MGTRTKIVANHDSGATIKKENVYEKAEASSKASGMGRKKKRKQNSGKCQ
jgi:hypothetical protein